MKSIYLLLFLSVLLTGTTCLGQNKNTVIVNGIPWFDDRGNIVNAHGACIVEDNGRYYLFGEWKSDKSNAFPGFSCYSSDDLVNWKFENVVLQVQPNGILGPNRVGERVKVMKCPKTGEYVMFMHADNMEYKDPYIGYATCKTINGNYQLHGPLLYQGKPIKRWDMGTFQDTDGKGYLLIHHGPIYRLSDDYHSVEAEVAYVKNSGESPAMFKKNGLYYMLYSNLTSWEKNDNFYFTAPRIEGPWTQQGIFCPKGTHAALVGEANPHSGYAKISIVNHKKDTVYSSLVDFYSQYPETAVRIITPRMPKDRYTLCVEVTGISPVWTDKTKRIYGSKGSLVCINQLCIFEK